MSPLWKGLITQSHTAGGILQPNAGLPGSSLGEVAGVLALSLICSLNETMQCAFYLKGEELILSQLQIHPHLPVQISLPLRQGDATG